MNPDKRPRVAEILDLLESTAKKVSNEPKIEADWKSFHSLIKVPAEFKVHERTQCSRDLFKELTQITLEAKSGQMVTGGTKLHDQKETKLCAYIATMSALRHQLKKAVGGDKSAIETFNLYVKNAVFKRFERDLAVMIGCVCPRALSARFKIYQSLFSFFNYLFGIISRIKSRITLSKSSNRAKWRSKSRLEGKPKPNCSD